MMDNDRKFVLYLAVFLVVAVVMVTASTMFGATCPQAGAKAGSPAGALHRPAAEICGG